jgi:hypothetical protein
MSNLYKVKERPELRKDMNTGAVLLSNKDIADDYMTRRNMLTKSKHMSEEINTIKSKLSEIDSLKEDMSEIKDLLKRIVNR